MPRCARMHSVLFGEPNDSWRLLMKHAVLLVLFCSLLPSTVSAQSDFFHAWEDRVRATSAKQPAWPVPVIGSLFDDRAVGADGLCAAVHVHAHPDVELRQWQRRELDSICADGVRHQSGAVHPAQLRRRRADGAGDFSVIAKYRPFAGDSEKGKLLDARATGVLCADRELQERDRGIDDNPHGGSRQRALASSTYSPR